MTLEIFLLGQFKIQHGRKPLEVKSRPAQSLFAFLAINSGLPHRREKLAGLLWPDSTESNARGYLRQALWQIRKSFEDHALAWEDHLEISKIDVKFKDQSDYRLDVQALLQDVSSLSIDDLTETLKYYRGELLPGFYDEWVPSERDRLQTVFHQKMTILLDGLIQNGQWDQVFEWGETWIRLGHAPEAAFRALMRAYAAIGDQAMVSTTYERCKEALESDLGLDVSSETTALYETLIRQEQSKPASPPAAQTAHVTVRPAFLDDPGYTPPEQAVFVAREHELHQLSACLEESLAGRGKVVFIVGEAGSGKTALLGEFTNIALSQHSELIAVNGSCNAQTGIGDPYLPMREILGMLTGDIEARLQVGELTADHANRLWEAFPRTTEALLKVGPDLIGTFLSDKALLARASSSATSNSGWVDRLRDHLERKLPSRVTPPGSEQQALLEQYSRVVRELSKDSPLLLILDDLQWADAGSISLLFHLGRQIQGCPILILGAYRSEEVALGRAGNRHPLEPVVNEFQRMFGARRIDLGQSNQKDFIEEFLDSEPNRLGRPFREMLFRQTQGHPLFTVELLRGMQESGDLVKDRNGDWEAGSKLDWEHMPARIEAVVAERINRLSQSSQTVLRAASVEGEIFTVEVLSRVLGMEESDLLALLSVEIDRKHRLVKPVSVQRIGDRLISNYRFRHTIFQRYLYNSLDDIERVHIHQDIGSAIEKLYLGKVDPSAIELQLARHFEIAGMPVKAIDYLHQAGDRAVQLPAYTEGITHLRKALDLLLQQPKSPTRDEKELDLQLSLALSWKYNWPSMRGNETVDRIRELCKSLGQTAPLAQVLGEQSIYHYVRAAYQQSLTAANEALELAQLAADPLLIAEGHWHLGILNFVLGEYLTSLEHLKEMDEFYKPDQHHLQLIRYRGVDAGLSARSYQACCLWCLGYLDQAIEASQTALELARNFQHTFTLVDVLSYAGCHFSAMMRDADSLQQYAEELIDLTSEPSLSLTGWVGLSRCFLGEALNMQGKFEQAISAINAGIADNVSTSVSLYMPMALRFLAHTQLETGKLDAANKSVEQALDIIEETGERNWEADLYRIQAKILLADGDHVEAEASYTRALELARLQQAKSWELRAAIDLASFWDSEGKRLEAYRLLSECYEWFTEGFDTPDLKRAQLLLEELA